MLKWEIFEKGKVEVIAKEFEPSYLLTQEMTLIPCILVRSDPWSLIAVLSQRKLVVALDTNP